MKSVEGPDLRERLMLMTANRPHIPVLQNEVLQAFQPVIEDRQKHQQSLRYFDGTFGRGGHLSAVLEKVPNLEMVAFDQDLEAITFGKENFASLMATQQLQLFHKNFSEFSSDDLGQFDLMLVDLGVSSPQLDQSERGFSFYHEGPLDMRMNQTQTRTAAEFVNEWDEDQLNQIFKEYGEVRSPYRVVKAIVHDRVHKKPFETTTELSGLIERVDRWRNKGVHPATQYFMALRLVVNRELEVLQQTLRNLILGLKPKGRIVVLTFHSLEDRIVKNIFKASTDLGMLVNKKVIIASDEEMKVNPRSRSCKLRAFERM